MNTLRHFVLWLDVPIEEITHKKLLSFIDHLLDKRLKPKTINCYLYSIRGFYEYLINEEQVAMNNPVIVAASAALSSRRTNYKTL
jgi:site-specific recombinase XerD